MGTNDNATDVLINGNGIRPFLIETLGAWQGDNLIGRMEALNTIMNTDCAPSNALSRLSSSSRFS